MKKIWIDRARLRRVVLSTALLGATAIAQGGLFDAWPYQMPISLPGYAAGETLTDFPVLVAISNDAARGVAYSQFNDDGSDLRFTDASGTNELSYQIDAWDTNGLSSVWVRVPALTSGASLTAYWGNRGVSLPAYATNGGAWAGYRGVWHFGLTDGAPDLSDATANHYDGVNGAGGSASTATNGGFVAFGESFVNARTQRFTSAYSSKFLPANNTPITVSCWANPNAIATGAYSNRLVTLFSKGSTTAGALIFGFDAADEVFVYHVNTQSVASVMRSAQTVSAGAWYHLAATFDGTSNFALYVNGQLDSVTNDTLLAGSTNGSMAVGATTTRNGHDGILDELEIAPVARSSNWVAACWSNQMPDSGFVDYGTVSTSALPCIANGGAATDVATNTATLTALLVSTGASPTTVWAWWGPVTTGTDWAPTFSTNLEVQSTGVVSVTVSGLLPYQSYYYRFYATNDAGECWATTPDVYFKSLGPAGAVTWTGGAGGTGTYWNSVANWDAGHLPGDEAVFNDDGLINSKVIYMGDSFQSVNKLTLNMTSLTNVQIGGSTDTYPLTLGDVTRSSGVGTVYLVAPVVLSSTNGLWDVGGGVLYVFYGNNGAYTARGTFTGTNLIKNGAGELRTYPWNTSGCPNFYGTTYVNNGTFRIACPWQGSIGNAVIGDGINAATIVDPGGKFKSGSTVLVRSNGTWRKEIASGADNSSIGMVTVEAGGTVYTVNAAAQPYFSSILLKGGSFTGPGEICPGTATITVDPTAPQMSLIDAKVGVRELYGSGSPYNWTTFAVNDTPSPVDLKVTGSIQNAPGASSECGFRKTGDGVMKVIASNTYGGKSGSEGLTYVQGGTLLVDNASGAGLGKGLVAVGYFGSAYSSARLGGTGTIGGLNYSTNANINLNTTGTNLVTLAPGTIDETDGSHVIGTLTVGSDVWTNNVAFGNDSRLQITFAADGSHDQLTVHGLVTFIQTNSLDLSVPDGVRGGTYTLVSADNGISGQFSATNGLPARGAIVYNATSIQLSLPFIRGSMILVR